MTWRPRWRDDATGYAARFAGQWAGGTYPDYDHLAAIVRAMPNGNQIQIFDLANQEAP